MLFYNLPAFVPEITM